MPGEFATANQVFSMVGVQFPAEGMYRFSVIGLIDAQTASISRPAARR